jgi:hypothetical protein
VSPWASAQKQQASGAQFEQLQVLFARTGSIFGPSGASGSKAGLWPITRHEQDRELLGSRHNLGETPMKYEDCRIKATSTRLEGSNQGPGYESTVKSEGVTSEEKILFIH